MGVLVICVLVFTVFCIVCTVFYCVVSFMCIYSYLFCLYWCNDYCHRVTTQLQLIIIIIIINQEMYDYTSNNWSHWNSNEKLKEKFGSGTRKTFDRFTTKDSYTWNITHSTESTAV